MMQNAPLTPGVHVTLRELHHLQPVAAAIRYPAPTRAKAAGAGHYRSNIRGRGVDFDEVRQYQPGDDIRNVDWRVTARSGKAHTKLFKEERDRPVFLVVDQRQSLFFGSQSAFKSVVAARAAAILAWHAHSLSDRIGGFIFSDQQHRELRPTGGKRGLQRFLTSLVEFNQALSNTPQDNNKHDTLQHALSGVQRVAKPGSLIFLISDFYGYSEQSSVHLSLLRRHCDIIAINIYDTLEKTLPATGTYAVSDGQHRLMINTTHKSTQLAYGHAFDARLQALHQAMRRLKIPLNAISTGDDLANALNLALRSPMGTPIETLLNDPEHAV